MTEAVQVAGAEAVATVDGDGRIALPPEIREALDLKEGDEVVLTLDQARIAQATLRRRSTVEQTYGVVPSIGRPLSPQEMNRISEEEMVREALDELRRATRPRSARASPAGLLTPLERLRAEAKRRGTPLDLDEARRRFEEEWPRQHVEARRPGQGENG